MSTKRQEKFHEFVINIKEKNGGNINADPVKDL
jgi:hypothetical protein